MYWLMKMNFMGLKREFVCKKLNSVLIFAYIYTYILCGYFAKIMGYEMKL